MHKHRTHIDIIVIKKGSFVDIDTPQDDAENITWVAETAGGGNSRKMNRQRNDTYKELYL